MKNRKRYNRIALMFLLVSICAMSIFGHQIWLIWQSDNASTENYALLADQVRHIKPVPDATSNNPDVAIDFTALRATNPDAVAWLYCPDTVIDYPVMRASDYNYYLHHLPDGTRNPNGSLFIDYNCPSDFSGYLTVIYGHHIKSGRMFGSLKGYKSQTYYEKHPSMYLYTEDSNYRIDLLYGCVIGANEWRNQAYMYEVNLDAFMDYAARNTTFTSRVQYNPGDQMVALSTCSYEFGDARYVVIGVLRGD